jgi:membrane-associated phospholipid phosphatase
MEHPKTLEASRQPVASGPEGPDSGLERARRIWQDARGFLWPLLVFAVGGGLGLLFLSKGDAVLWVNARHTAAMDVFFRYATWLGDGLFWFLALALLTAYRRRFGLLSLLAAGLSALCVQGLKNLLDIERPSRYLVGHDLHFVPGVDVHGFLSFPSGHTGAAFTGFFLLALYSRKPAMGLVCFAGAAIAGFSRIYLVQHFFADVYAGALLGTAVAFGFVWAFRHRGWFAGA